MPNTTRSPALSGVDAADLAAVDLDAVGGPEVGDGPLAAGTRADLRVAPGHVRVAQHDVALAAAPDDRATGRDHEAPALGLQDRPPRAVGARLGQRLLRAIGRRVDHRVPVVSLLGGFALRPHQARLDAELAEVQALVGAELDDRSRHHRQPLAPRVLEQVGAQLVDDLVLDALVALAILRRQPDRVLVWHVCPRHRHGPVVVHLARQLAREFDRAHL